MESFSRLLRPDASVYFVGIKGTGVCALAELFHSMGVKTGGSDTGEVFYTDAILKELGIPYAETFDAAHISGDIDAVIHSAAYSAESNEELAEAQKKSLPTVTYPDALGAYSLSFDSAGVTGVHGKTTTTAIYGYSESDTINSNVVKNSSGIVQSNWGHAVFVSRSSFNLRRDITAGPEVSLSYNGSNGTISGGWEF